MSNSKDIEAQSCVEVEAPATLPRLVLDTNSLIVVHVLIISFRLLRLYIHFVSSGVHVRSARQWTSLYRHSSGGRSGEGAKVFCTFLRFGRRFFHSGWTLEGE
jgi:hypothetical protein